MSSGAYLVIRGMASKIRLNCLPSNPGSHQKVCIRCLDSLLVRDGSNFFASVCE